MPEKTKQPADSWPALILALLPRLNTLAELKVTLACLLSGEWPTLDDLQRLTGLSRTSVVQGRRRARDRGLVAQLLAPGQSLDSRPCLLYIDSQESKAQSLNRLDTPTQSQQTNNVYGPDSELESKLLTELVELGLAEHIARRLLDHHEPEYIRRHIDQTQYAERCGRIKSSRPGYLYNSIKQNWTQSGFTPAEGLRQAGLDLDQIYAKIYAGQIQDPHIEKSIGYQLWCLDKMTNEDQQNDR